nr:UDP-N-acetylglucosamine 1-carboxyvinyltransferase [Eubacterium sp.]
MFIEIEGGKSASGDLEIQGSKNAALPIIAAAILTKEPVVLAHCPKIQDVYAMIAMLRSIGVNVWWDEDALVIHAEHIRCCKVTEPMAGEIRASVLFLGALLGRCGQAGICMPGGCSIGARPIDFHMSAFSEMGVSVSVTEEEIWCEATTSGAQRVRLPYPSVGATENVILYAVLGSGRIIVDNVAKEPEIQELCRFLRSMGARIRGEGTGRIEIIGVRELHSTVYQLPADRIVFLTYAAVVAATCGNVFLQTYGQCFPAECMYLEKIGCRLRTSSEGIWIWRKDELRSIPYVRTGPYPRFPTDAQSLFLALMTRGNGKSTIEESVFENRFLVVSQLQKMGAEVEVEGQCAYVQGVERLRGASVVATDLRSGAALMVAGTMAEGTTVIDKCHFILRGYEWPVECLQRLGLGARYRCE